MKPLSSFHHVALSVSDMELSARWYADVLGMVELFRESSEERKAVVFSFANGVSSVGVVEHVGSRDPFDPTVTGLDHFAFSVDSPEEMQAWAAHLDSLGVEHSGAIDIPPGQILNFKDPDGIALSLFWHRTA